MPTARCHIRCQIQIEYKVSYDPNAEVRTRYRSDVYSEQCVQSKHREITNYYINITVAFIAYSISDLVFLEGQSLYTNSHPLCVLSSFFFRAWEALKKLGDSTSCLPRKKPFPPKFPRNRQSDGGRFIVDQSCTTPV